MYPKKKDIETSQTDLETLPKVSQKFTRVQPLVNTRFDEAGSVAGSELHKASSLRWNTLKHGCSKHTGLERGNARRIWRSWVTKRGSHPPRTGQKGPVIFRFWVKFRGSSAGSWNSLLVLELGLTWLSGRVCYK